MSRAEFIQENIDYHKQRQREAMEVYYEAADRIAELEAQKRGLGQLSLRHLTLVVNNETRPEANVSRIK